MSDEPGGVPSEGILGDLTVFPGRIADPYERAINTQHLLGLARKKARDSKLFDEHPPYFFEADISNGRHDSYFTRMAKSSLKNYAKNAKAGVAVLIGHNRAEANFGMSLTGEYFANGDAGPEDEADEGHTGPLVRSSAYALPVDERSQAMIKRIDGGLQRDVSIGFTPGRFVCSIDGKNLFGMDCRHIPGLYYNKKTGEVSVKDDPNAELALADVEDAQLREWSLVYAGATPGAALRKAELEAGAGRLDPLHARYLEAALRYPGKIPGADRIFAPLQARKGGSPMGDTNDARTDGAAEGGDPAAGNPPNAGGGDTRSGSEGGEQNQVDRGQRRSPVAVDDGSANRLDGVVILNADLRRVGGFEADATGTDVLRAVETLRAQVAELTPRAEEATKYRGILIEQTIAAGVRAMGNAFNVEITRKSYAALSIEEIEATRKLYDEASPITGERKTREQVDPPGDGRKNGDARLVKPLGAYRP